jgi:hypothetical protein
MSRVWKFTPTVAGHTCFSACAALLRVRTARERGTPLIRIAESQRPATRSSIESPPPRSRGRGGLDARDRLPVDATSEKLRGSGRTPVVCRPTRGRRRSIIGGHDRSPIETLRGVRGPGAASAEGIGRWRDGARDSPGLLDSSNGDRSLDWRRRRTRSVRGSSRIAHASAGRRRGRGVLDRGRPSEGRPRPTRRGPPGRPGIVPR